MLYHDCHLGFDLITVVTILACKSVSLQFLIKSFAVVTLSLARTCSWEFADCIASSLKPPTLHIRRVASDYSVVMYIYVGIVIV